MPDLEVSAYLFDFVDSWTHAGLLGDAGELVSATDTVHLYWQPDVFTSKEIKNYPLLDGLTKFENYDDGTVPMFLNDHRKVLRRHPHLCDTSLGHELTHLFLRAATGSQQSNHFNNPDTVFPLEYESVIDDVNSRHCQ